MHLQIKTLASCLFSFFCLIQPSHADIIIGTDDGNGNIIDTDVTINQSNHPILIRVYVGGVSDGVITYNNGVNTRLGMLTIGSVNGGNGKVNITGSDTQVELQTIIADIENTSAALNISNAAKLITESSARFGKNAIVNVQGNNTQWNITSSNYGIRLTHNATINISDNATINTNYLSAESPNTVINLNNATLNVQKLIAHDNLFQGYGIVNKTGTIYTQDTFFHSPEDLIDTEILTGENRNITINTNYAFGNVTGITGLNNPILSIKNGVQINSHVGYIADGEDQSGTVNLEGQNTKWNIAGHLFAAQGQGMVNITNGAELNAYRLAAGNQITGNVTITVNGINSRLKISDTATLSNQSILNIENHATVNFDTLRIWDNAKIVFDNGTLNVKEFNNTLTQKLFGTGQINTNSYHFTQSHTFSNQDDLRFNRTISNGHTQNINLNVDFSQGAKYVELFEGVSVDVTGQNTTLEIRRIWAGLHGRSDINVSNGATLIIDDMSSGNPGPRKIPTEYIATNLTIQGPGSKLQIDSATLWGTTVINIKDGGQFITDYQYSLPRYIFILELNDHNQPMIVADEFKSSKLYGAKIYLDFSMLDDIQVGDEYILIENLNQDFEPNQLAIMSLDETKPELSPKGMHFRISYQGGDGNDIALIATKPDLGDANGDGQINQLDLDLVQQYLGTNNFLGDANHDGTVNLQDLFAVRNNFRTDGRTTIPEPTTFLTLLTLGPLMLRRKKQD